MMQRCTWIRAALAAAIVGTSATAQATDYVVDTITDSDAQDGQISLREAITAAMTDAEAGDAAAGSPDGDTITFGGLQFIAGGTISLMGGELPAISDDLSIDGTTAGGNVVIDAGGSSRIFMVTAPSATGDLSAVSFANLTLTNGNSDGNDDTLDGNGGAMYIAASAVVSLDNVSVTGSEATGVAASNGGGAIFNAGELTITNGSMTGNAASGTSGSGGAIFNSTDAVLSIDGTTIANNSAARAGGGIETIAGASVSLTNVLLGTADLNGGNSTGSNPGNGGGLHMTGAGTVTMTGGSVRANTAASEGGGLWNGSGTMTLSGVIIDGNTASGAGADNGGGGIFNNNGGTLIVTDDTQITNNIADGASGSGGGVFIETDGTVTITGGAITGNRANRAGGGIEDKSGAGTTLTLNNVDLSDNNTGVAPATASPGNGGGLHVTGDGAVVINGGTINGNVAAREGGGLWNGSGSMSIDGSTTPVTISGNTASGAELHDGGGGIFNNGGVLTLTAVSITGNIADGAAGSGGGILSLGGTEAGTSVTASNSIISSNRANRAGGGIETQGTHAMTLTTVTMNENNAGVDPATAAPGNGGAIHISGSGTVDIVGGTFNSNVAAREGGALWNQAGTVMTVSNATLDGNTAAGADAHDGGGALFNNGSGTAVAELVLNNLMVTNNAATGALGSGGGLFNLGGQVTISGGTFSGNTAVRAGGAVEDRSVDAAGSAALATTVSFDQVTVQTNSTGGSPGNGGGLHITGGDSVVTVNRSTFSGNTAANEGGGLWNFNGSELTVVNSTVSGNEATATDGGGLFNRPAGNLVLIHTTVAGNTATGNGGGVFNADTGLVTTSNTLIGDNSAETGNDFSGDVAADFTLIEDQVGANITGANNLSGDAGLAELAFNGGVTQTHAIDTSSIAIDAADSAVCADINNAAGIDQRGVPRDDDCDLGAFEFSNGPVIAASSTVTTDATVQPGDTDVEVLGFTFSNTSGETVRFDGFSGQLRGTANYSNDISASRLYLDANGNGVFDSGDTELTGAGDATLTLNAGAQSFQVSFDPARTLADGAEESYLLVVDVRSGSATVAMLGMGTAGLMMIGMLAAPRQRRWALLTAALAAALLGGCRGSNNNAAAPVDATVQLRLTAVDAEGVSSGAAVQGLVLPLTGPTITIDR